MPNLHTFELEFENTVVTFEISVLEIVLLKSLVPKEKSLNLDTKMFYLGIFGVGF